MKNSNVLEKRKIIAVDLDGTLTEKARFPEIYDITPRELGKIYSKVKPKNSIIKLINHLYDKGYIIYIFTSRNDLFQRQIKKWLAQNKIKYHYFITNKPFYDILIDDKAIRPEELELWGGL
jgi:uncharacterized HAD superfamily protein